MLEGLVSFQFGGFYGGDLGRLLNYLENAGFFTYVLPFLLIFAVVFGILTKVDLFKKNKTINVVISLAVGLLSLQFSFVPMFFSEIFPRLGIALAVILVAFILLGIFLPGAAKNKGVAWGGLIIALVIFVIVLVQSFQWTGGSWTWWIRDNWMKAVLPLVVLGAIAAIINHGNDPPKIPSFTPVWRNGGSDGGSDSE